jgi:hypothetical protein
MNCAVLCVKDDWKDSSEASAIACHNFAIYSVFSSGMTSHSKIAQTNLRVYTALKVCTLLGPYDFRILVQCVKSKILLEILEP